MSILAAVLLLIGSAFCALAALGVVRFPDVYTRLHAASKAGPLGAGMVLVALGIQSGDPVIFVRALVGLLFLLITAPVSAHLLARAAQRSGVSPVPGTSKDEYEDGN